MQFYHAATAVIRGGSACVQLRMTTRTASVLARAAALAAFALAGHAHAESGQIAEWRFSALLDGAPIGTHRFVLRVSGSDVAVREVESTARFEVKLLGFVAYRYEHRTRERWRGDCVESIVAQTNDNGTVTDLRGQASADGLAVDVRRAGAGDRARASEIAGCAMTFAYWNPSLATQRRLLDPATGRVESVTISALPPATVEARGQSHRARGLRIAGLAHPIDVWYAGDEWIGLDTTVDGGRRLSYRAI